MGVGPAKVIYSLGSFSLNRFMAKTDSPCYEIGSIDDLANLTMNLTALGGSGKLAAYAC